jgi:hypothetical protein
MSKQEKWTGESFRSPLHQEDNAERAEAQLVHRAQFSDQREQRQVHGNDHAADDDA